MKVSKQWGWVGGVATIAVAGIQGARPPEVRIEGFLKTIRWRSSQFLKPSRQGIFSTLRHTPAKSSNKRKRLGRQPLTSHRAALQRRTQPIVCKTQPGISSRRLAGGITMRCTSRSRVWRARSGLWRSQSSRMLDCDLTLGGMTVGTAPRAHSKRVQRQP